jgi:GntR family transcriptional repressor for pyruvate dehydrogenase complex
MLKPVEKQRVAEEIVEQLRALILTGQYPAGSKLPPERELSKKLGVNRASLREALKKLEHLGLVRIRQGDGTRVLDFMATGGLELMRHLLPLASPSQPLLIRDLLEFRRLIGREIARVAAYRAKPTELGRLRELAAAGQAATAALELFEIDFDFYVALTQLTGNQVMVLLINTVREGVRSYAHTLANLAAMPDVVRAHHRDLLAALEAHDPDRAARIADDYLASGAELAARFAGRPDLAPLPLPA